MLVVFSPSLTAWELDFIFSWLEAVLHSSWPREAPNNKENGFRTCRTEAKKLPSRITTRILIPSVVRLPLESCRVSIVSVSDLSLPWTEARGS